MKINISEFKSCVSEPPKYDGEYLVVRVSSCSNEVYSATSMSYTVKYGWNTSVDNYKHRVTFDNDAYWATMSVGSGLEIV